MTDTFLHQLLTLPTVLQAELSPDGQWVAFIWYRIHENLDVFVVPTDGLAAPIALTHTPEATRLVRWTPDSRAVIVAEDHDSDEHVRLFRVDRDRPLVMQPLTEDRPPYFLRGGSLDPTGRMLYYAANYDFARAEVTEQPHIYRHDLRLGERVPIAQLRHPAFTVPVLNSLGTHVLFGGKDRHPAGYQMHLVDVEGGEVREILNFGDTIKVFGYWMPDGERVLALSEARDGHKQAHHRVGLYHIATGELRWLVDDPSRSIEGVRATRDGLIIIDEVREARHVTSFLDPVTGVEIPFLQLPGNPVPRPANAGRDAHRMMGVAQGNLQPIGQAADGAWISLYYSSTLPTELVRFTPAARTPADLISLTRDVWEHTQLDRTLLTPAEDFRWTAADGLELQGWLYRAQPNPQRAIIFIHGGPTAHSEDRLNPEIAYFVSQGFNVLDVNYRGSTGFGLKFRELIKEDGWGGREQSDIAAGAETLLRMGLADVGRIGVTGTSYGGYSAWFLITHESPELIAASAPICGMTDLVVDYNTTRPDLRPYSEEMLGGSPTTAPGRYFERSPINFVQNIRGHLLIVQGAQDPNVTPENVRQVVERLEAHHIPYDLLVFADEGHGILKPANQHRLYTRLAEFFDRALGPLALWA